MKYPFALLTSDNRDTSVIAPLLPLHFLDLKPDEGIEYEAVDRLYTFDFTKDHPGFFPRPLALGFIAPHCVRAIYGSVIIFPWMETMLPALKLYRD